MKKKLTTMVIAAACALTCAVALTGCGKKDAYYNKTYTLTGTCTIDWTGKRYSDSYAGETKDVSQKQILERHWDKIDWDKTFERAEADGSKVPHSNVDEFINSFASYEQNYYKDAAGLKVSVSKKDAMTITITLPDEIMKNMDYSNYYPAELTMPFAETNEQLSAIKPHNEYTGTIYYEERGYHGKGIYKKDDEHFVEVQFSIGTYTNYLSLGIWTYTYKTDAVHSHFDMKTVFNTNSSVVTIYDTAEKEIRTVESYIDYEVKKN